MAEGLLRKLVEDADLPVEVGSAGTSAWEGGPAQREAIDVAASEGLDIAGHSARLLTADLVRWADITLGMSMTHVLRARNLDDTADVRLITEFHPDGERRDGIPDPMGWGREAYEAAFGEIEACLRGFLERHLSALSGD